jgi:recombination protein RecA
MVSLPLSRSGSILVFVNQLRENIGAGAYAPPETTPGGRAVKFWASMRLDVRRIAAIKDGEEEIGHRARIFVRKNKVAPPHRECFLDMISGKGFSHGADLLDAALECKVIEQKGAWFACGDSKLGQGRVKVAEMLEEDTELASKIRKALIT